MDNMKRRNPPKTPKTEKFDAEILLSLYREGRTRRVLRIGCLGCFIRPGATAKANQRQA